MVSLVLVEMLMEYIVSYSQICKNSHFGHCNGGGNDPPCIPWHPYGWQAYRIIQKMIHLLMADKHNMIINHRDWPGKPKIVW